MNPPSRYAMAGLSGALAAGTFLTTTTIFQSEAVPVVSGCAIRFTANGPAIHANSTHHCTGARALSVAANGDLVIESSQHGAIISVTAEEDETLSRKGIQAGASGGLGRTVVRFYSSRTGAAVRADDVALQDPYSNLWMTWVNAG